MSPPSTWRPPVLDDPDEIVRLLQRRADRLGGPDCVERFAYPPHRVHMPEPIEERLAGRPREHDRLPAQGDAYVVDAALVRHSLDDTVVDGRGKTMFRPSFEWGTQGRGLASLSRMEPRAPQSWGSLPFSPLPRLRRRDDPDPRTAATSRRPRYDTRVPPCAGGCH